VTALDPEHYLAYAGRSEIHWSRGDSSRATLDPSTVIGLQPEFHGGYALRALAYQRRGKLDEARQDYARAIELDPAWRSVETARAYLTICRDDALRAVEALLD